MRGYMHLVFPVLGISALASSTIESSFASVDRGNEGVALRLGDLQPRGWHRNSSGPTMSGTERLDVNHKAGVRST
ncbi:hypothetical protein P280DRAFT_39575 [Massarina eburnea CBS 473.64]|uniref:Uncharacterized protein n=1 Tax=Massarina eburnea CBS 473.64 TaxID=1395130 RepID=A0A6A6RWL8_9PLEO|nr:hypothetical protein P280DRAFT_39575 [Massarina eburnea CBS 473.64]